MICSAVHVLSAYQHPSRPPVRHEWTGVHPRAEQPLGGLKGVVQRGLLLLRRAAEACGVNIGKAPADTDGDSRDVGAASDILACQAWESASVTWRAIQEYYWANMLRTKVTGHEVATERVSAKGLFAEQLIKSIVMSLQASCTCVVIKMSRLRYALPSQDSDDNTYRRSVLEAAPKKFSCEFVNA